MNHRCNKKRQNQYRVLLIFLLIFNLLLIGFSYNQSREEEAKETESKAMVSATDTTVIPCGIPVGIYVETEGLLVIDTQPLKGQDGMHYEPAKDLIKTGDYIVAIDGKRVESKEEMQKIVALSQGNSLKVELRRDREKKIVKLTPVMTEEGVYRLGIWLRDDTQGLGTITYIQGNQFGALGHGISDYDTGTQMEVGTGSLYAAEILSVKRGERGMPGELIGQVFYQKDQHMGTIQKAGSEGIYGNIDCEPEDITNQSAMPIAAKEEVKKGKAKIRFALDGEAKDYEIRILKADITSKKQKQGIVFEVVDKELIRRTGGIVQGMSGSPVIQNGRIVGAVTHVLVNDPTRGYGIFIENMLEAAE